MATPSKPQVKVMSSQHNAGRLSDMSGSTPAELAQELGINLSEVSIYVGGSAAKPDTPLTNNDPPLIVSFQREKVTSGK